MAEDTVELEIVRGEDWSAQIYWTDQWGDSIPVGEPVEATVRDAVGQVVMRFLLENDASFMPALTYNSMGFFQLTIPASRTWTLIAGRYDFDLWAAVLDSAPPFNGQRHQVVSGVVDVSSPISKFSQQ